mgnify:CR=1 FL=1
MNNMFVKDIIKEVKGTVYLLNGNKEIIYEYKKIYKEKWKFSKKFTCGNIVIDKFLHDGSALDVNRGITYIMLSDDNNCTNGWMILLIDNLNFL